MARRRRPGRELIIFFIGSALLFGLVALAGVWKPELGLDLQGGTRITLVSKGDVSASQLEEARKIIDQRVNGSGVSESEVATQGNRYIVVEIPGDTRRDLVNTVERQAQMRFRLVAASAPGTSTGAAPDPTSPDQGQPGSGVTAPAQPQPSSSGTTGAPAPSASPSAKPKPRVGWGKPLAAPSTSPSAEAFPSDAGNGGASGNKVQAGLAFQDNPPADWVSKFQSFQCPAKGAPEVDDNPDQPLITCGEDDGYKYLLTPAVIEGSSLDSADAMIPQNELQWIVNLNFDGAGTKDFAQVSRALYGTEKQFAIVLDGVVISAPTMDGVISDGNAQISGGSTNPFTESQAQSLATSLKYGALPIAFEDQPLVETVGPSLAGDQLHAGLLAGLFGLLLVMLYCLVYYRGLGIVVLSSLLVAAALTYAVVLLLSKTAGFTLTLPGIAGFIVAVGITADSFIVYFERIRDEMRDGKSMRVAVEAGWARARNTCLAADAVSLLAAVVLYIFAAGVVKGFAFALGVSTLIDLAVFFWFTHPLVSWLARFPFFNRGHKLSGLDAGALGVDRLPAGGRA